MLGRVLVITSLVVALVACKEKAPPARAVQPPTAEEAEAFGKEFAKKLAPCDASAIDSVIDVDLLVDRSIAHRKVNKSERDGLKRGLGSLGQKICEQLQDPGVSATYLRSLTVDGTPRPLIRLLFTEGLNYYQLELDKTGGSVRVADLYIYLTGENMSDTFGKLIDLLLNTSAGASAGALNEVKSLMVQGRWQDAHAALKRLPEKLRASKAIKLMEVQITSEINDDTYVKVLDEYAKAYPGDASLALVQLDRQFLRKEYDATLTSLGQLDKQVGGDPYLEIMRAEVYMASGKPADGLEAAKRATTAEPTLELGWWTLLVAQAVSNQYPDALATLGTLREKFGSHVGPEVLGADERLAPFVASDEYKNWMASGQGGE